MSETMIPSPPSSAGDTMTLRDYFAAQIVTSFRLDGAASNSPSFQEKQKAQDFATAKRAYAVADAMLAARNVTQ